VDGALSADEARLIEEPRGVDHVMAITEPVWIIRLLNREGVRGLNYLRLWGHFNDLIAAGVDQRLRASVSLYLTATAHAYMAFVSLRKLLDTQRRAVSVHRLLDAVEATIPALIAEMAQRDAELRIDEPQLREVLSRHRDLLCDLVRRAEPALTMVNRLIVHLDGQHVDNLRRWKLLLEQGQLADVRGFYREAQSTNGGPCLARGAGSLDAPGEPRRLRWHPSGPGKFRAREVRRARQLMAVVAANVVTADHRAVFDAVWAALMECLGLGHREVERVCNEERERRLLRYRALRPTDIAEPTMPNITAAAAIRELTPPFALIAPPDPIVVDFVYRRRRDADPTAPDDRPSMGVGVPGLRLFAFIDAIDVGARERCWVHRSAALPSTVSHLCGDATLNGATDGILRHNLAGVDAIRARLARS
jgi:hypothetical protein